MKSDKNMYQTRNRFLTAIVLSLGLASAATAEIPFQMQITQGPLTNTIPNDSVLTMVAPIGQSQTIAVRAVYTGTGVVTVTQPPAVTGSSAFTATLNQSLPVTLNPGQTLFFSLRFGPITPVPDTARLIIAFAETPASTITPITLSLQGVTSAIVPSYTSPDDNNIVPLQPGATIPFPATLVGESTPVTLNFTNIGSTIGQVTKVTVAGSAFRLQDLPLFPANVAAGQNLQMKVLFKPTAVGASTGTLTLETIGAEPVTIRLEGTAVAPKLSYQLGTPPVAISAGATISLPTAEVGLTSAALLRVTNTGSANSVVNAIATVGANFQVTNAPLLPQTLAPNASLIFTVTFTPSRTGVQTGTLIVNNLDVFNLSGSGLGPLLSFSYVAAGATITLGGNNNTVFFSPVRVSESAALGLDIKNTGTTAATLVNIGIGQANGPFSIVNAPALPTNIAPNATLRITLKFEPIVVGFANTTLIIDNTNITLTGSGTAPPALPSYTLSGPTGTVAPLTQPSVGLKLAVPYPVALTGTLTLAPAAANLPSDPAVQFATGGRTIAFRIPANTTDAVFGAQGTQVGLQTGTVAGTMTLTPSFSTQAGNVDLTPATPITSQFTVGVAAPTLVSVQVQNATTTGFTLQVTGFTTTRSLTALNIQFTVASGFKMPTTQFNVDLKSIAAAWFQSTASQAFGGQFRITIPFTFQVPANQFVAGETILNGISSISVTTANESGTSTALQARTQ